MSSMDGSGLGANDWTEMELKKRAYPVVTLDSAALQGRIAVDDLAIRLQSLGAPDRSRWFGHRERRAAVSRGPCIRGALTSVKDRAPGWVHQYVLLAYWERSLYVLIRTFSSLSLSLTLYFFFVVCGSYVHSRRRTADRVCDEE